MSDRPLPSLPSHKLTYENVEDKPGKKEERKIKFRLEEGTFNSKKSILGKLLKDNSLPLVVKVQNNCMDNAGQLVFGEGEFLLLHFLRYSTRDVQAIDSHGNRRVFPTQTSDVYEILPQNPVHDDQIFRGTVALIQSEPLPKFVRILQTERSTSGHVCNNDVISLSHIEETTDKHNHWMLVGTCKGKRVKISQLMTSYVYTTMISEKTCTLSEITANNEFPIRVRKVESGHALQLTGWVKEARVIATRMNHPVIHSIPVTSHLQVEKFQHLEVQKFLKGLLPVAIYSLIENGESDVFDVQEITQPALKSPTIGKQLEKTDSETTDSHLFRHSHGSVKIRPSTSPRFTDLSTASMDEVITFLRRHRFDEYVDICRREKINWKMLCQFEQDDIQRKLEMPRIQAKRLALEIKHANDQTKKNTIQVRAARSYSMS